MSPKPEILIVEDDDYWIEHYSRVLQHQAIDICKAKTVQEAIKLLNARCFAGAIIDIELPGSREPKLGGFEVIEAVRRRNVYTELLVVTGRTEGEIVDRVSRLGVNFILKHIEPRELSLSASAMIEAWRRKFATVEAVIDKFADTIPILQVRGHGKPAFKINDEYDVQDLLHFLYKPYLSDVIVEEYTLKRAGKTKRLDLVFKGLQTVIETKIVRTKAHASKIPDELDIDIRGYVSHPSCRHLFCFVYDPDRHIKDPRNVEKDLSGEHSQDGKIIDVSVVIRPR
jgi:response regulator RpfG family c-di-GMP phosphodiesterase